MSLQPISDKAPTRSFKDADGTRQTRYGCEIIAEQVDFLAKAKESSSEEPKKRRSK